ncbi:MAG: hypothetical protein ACX931_16800 [Saccharospirillum sp.]
MYERILKNLMKLLEDLSVKYVEITFSEEENGRSYLTPDTTFAVLEVREMMDSIISGEIDPKKDWNEKFIPKRNKHLLKEQLQHHKNAVKRQIAFCHYIREVQIDLAYSNDNGIILDSKIIDCILDMQKALYYGHAHWGAFNILNIKFEREEANIPSKGGQAKAKKLKQENQMLNDLIEIAIVEKKPSRGWGTKAEAAKQLSDFLSENIDYKKLHSKKSKEDLQAYILESIINEKAQFHDLYLNHSRQSRSKR